MHRRTFFYLTLVIGLLTLTAIFLIPQQRIQAQDGSTGQESETIVLGNAGTAFTYQGRIVFNGSAVDNEICSIIPTLWTAKNGGSQLATSSQTAVRPSNGFFSMNIDFGRGAFTGGERWLQLHVSCASDPHAAQGTTLPRIRLAPAPYALGLAPGVYVQNANTNITAFAATNGQSWSIPLLVASKISAIWGDSQYDDGVMGLSQQGNGIYGYSETGKAVYADGDAHVEGNLTWKAHKSYLSLPASMLKPQDDGASVFYHSDGYVYCETGHCWVVAPVLLPHGARVTEIKTWWSDSSTADNALLRLLRVSPGSLSEVMVDLETSGDSGNILVSSESNISLWVRSKLGRKARMW